MEQYYELLVNRLQTRRNELASRQEHFRILVQGEMDSGCFEQNAINSLIVMTQLKKEIEELEFEEAIVRSQLK